MSATSSAAAQTSAPLPPSASGTAPGMRQNGKNWHAPKTAFRPSAGLTSYEKRAEQRKAIEAVKAREKEMKAEKETAHQAAVQRIRDKRAAKEERERYEKMAEKMHRKRVERVKRREKRNKMLKS